MRPLLPLLLLTACEPSGDDTFEPEPFPAADAWGATTGPGVPQASFEETDLFLPCAFLRGDVSRSADHHNLVVMHDGWLVMPWAPEDGVQRIDWDTEVNGPVPTPEEPGVIGSTPGVFGGGITLWDLTDPCFPTKAGEGWSPWMRESHTIAFGEYDGRTYAAVDFLAWDGSGGVGFWDITDPTNPVWVHQVRVPDHMYPDSYTSLTLSVTWQGRYLFAATAFQGTWVLDVSDPLAAEIVDIDPSTPEPDAIPHEQGPVGSFHVWGNVGMASSAGTQRTILWDLSDPTAPERIVGGTFDTRDADGTPGSYYFANVGKRYGLFARSNGGGGPIVYDLTDPSAPTEVFTSTSSEGDGGYVFQHEDMLFVGDSDFGTAYDFSDPFAPEPVGTFLLRGDLDTVTPIGPLAFVSVDEDANDGQATAVMPWSAEPDTRPPEPGMTSPADGATKQALTSRIGVVFDEMIEPVSVFPGSFRVRSDRGAKVAGRFNVQENIVNFSPDAELEPGTTYTVRLPTGGLVDLSGNALAEELVFSFTTKGERVEDEVE